MQCEQASKQVEKFCGWDFMQKRDRGLNRELGSSGRDESFRFQVQGVQGFGFHVRLGSRGALPQ